MFKKNPKLEIRRARIKSDEKDKKNARRREIYKLKKEGKWKGFQKEIDKGVFNFKTHIPCCSDNVTLIKVRETLAYYKGFAIVNSPEIKLLDELILNCPKCNKLKL